MNRHIRQVKELEDDIAAITQQMTLATRVTDLAKQASVFVFLIKFWCDKTQCV